MACSLSLCNSASAILEKGTQGGERRERKNTRCSHSRKSMGTSGGGRAWIDSGRAEGRPGRAQGAAGRAVRAAGSPAGSPAGWPGLSLWPPPARPPGCAPAPRSLQLPPLPLAALVGTWAQGSHWEGAPARGWFSAPTSGPSLRPLGYAGPSDGTRPPEALGGQRPWGGRRGWDWGGPPGADRQRACGRALRAHCEPLGRTACAPGWTHALWGKRRGRLQGADASQGASG